MNTQQPRETPARKFLKNQQAQSRVLKKNKIDFVTLSRKGFFLLCLIFCTFGVVFYPVKKAEASLLANLIGYFVGGASANDTSITPASVSLPLLGSDVSPTDSGEGDDTQANAGLVNTTQNSALIASHNPIGTFSANQDKIVVYTVSQGDTLSGIAANFGISVNTILWANNIRDPKTIKIGDSLVILPVTGVQYKVKKGDTLESIAKKFKPKNSEVSLEDFLNEMVSFNGLAVGENLVADSVIIIPEGEITAVPPPKPGSRSGTSSYSSSGNTARFAQYPEYQGYYMRPIIGGRKSRGIHGYNGVDLANSCGVPIMASAAGSVIVAKTTGWNGGYGKYVVIAHDNGTQTLYAHMSALLVAVGDQVIQGFHIGDIGTTGNSTGCHVHFEIRGAVNPF